MKYILVFWFAIGLTPLYGQMGTVFNAKKLAADMSSAKSLEEKLRIFNAPENKMVYKDKKNVEAGAAFYIASEYIKLGDVKNAIIWMNLVKPAPQFHEHLLADFYPRFQKLGEHKSIVESFQPEMDSLYHILKDRKDTDGTAMDYYAKRLRHYMISKLALKQYSEVVKHLEMIYQYRGNTFANNSNYYQYVEGLLALDKGEQAIAVFAKFMAEKVDFSPDVQKTKELLVSKVKNGGDKFKTELAANASVQINNYQRLINSLVESNGANLKERLGKSKYILLNFWGSWSGSCTAEHPKLIEMYNQYRGFGLEVLGIAQENGSDRVEMEKVMLASVKQQGLPWLQTLIPPGRDPSHPVIRYIVTAYPTKILIDKEGRIIARITGSSLDNFDFLEQTLNELMGDSESKTRQLQMESAQNTYNLFLKAGSLAQKEEIYKSFVSNESLNRSDLAPLSEKMLQDLAIGNAKAKKMNLAKAYHEDINEGAVKGKTTLELIKYMSANTEKLTFIEHHLEKLRPKESSKMAAGHKNIYAQLVKAYISLLPKEGAESKKYFYLTELYNTVGGFFITDEHFDKERVVQDLDKTLTYTYAKVLSKQSKYKEAAHVLITYLNADSNYHMVKAKMLVDFKEISNLSELFKQSKPTGQENNQLLLSRVLLKEDIDGKVITDNEAKYYLLDFWGSWCQPCRFGNPHLKELYAKYKEDGFEIIGIAAEGSGPNVEIKLKNLRSAIFQDGLPWIQMLADDLEDAGFDPLKAFDITSYPTKILFDKEKKVIGVYKGGDDDKLDAKLKVIFNK